MDARQEKGRLLAQNKRIKNVDGDLWFVPSQAGDHSGYVVNPKAGSCTCPDFEERRTKCKHQWAVTFVTTVEVHADGSTVTTESVTVTRKTYAQDWPAYNAAQCSEKEIAQNLLRALCDGIQTPPHAGRGPKPFPLGDATYAMVMKVYTTMSGRRATTDLEACASAGHMENAPRYNTVFRYLAKPEMTPLLTKLVEESAAPLAAIETQFAVDSTGFGTVTYRRWFDQKYGKEMKQRGWVKAHCMTGTATNCITAINVTGEDGADSPELPALLTTTTHRFEVKEVSADKAYLSHANLAAIESVGAVPYIPFKINSQGEGPAAWKRMWALFTYKQPEFAAHYHRRSNVETTFSAVKRLFGAFVRSKDPVAQVNEVLCKAIAYNLSCLVHAIYELGIDPQFPRLTVGVAP